MAHVFGASGRFARVFYVITGSNQEFAGVVLSGVSLVARIKSGLLAVAALYLLHPALASAIGLGEIHLHSALNQPLRAEIELLALGDLGADDFRVQLASAEVFQRSGVERFHFLSDLRFTLILRGGKTLIRVQSNKPVREPYLNFIVELTRPGGSLLREYTVLIDPPRPGGYASAPAQESARVVAAPTERREVARPLPAASRGQRYQVRPGDSLWSLAGRLRDSAQASRQTLMADILALNPQAFAGGDPQRLRADAELLLPDVVTLEPAAPAALPAVSEQVEAPVVEPELVASVALAEQQSQLAEAKAENQVLRDSIQAMQDQLATLQAQMAERDRQLAQSHSRLQAEVQRLGPAVPVTPPVIETAPAVVERTGWHWWLLAALTLLVFAAGFWALRLRRQRQKVVPINAAQVAATVSASPSRMEVASVVPATAPLETPDDASLYLAYGRLGAAAQALRSALAESPERLDLRLRLVDIYGDQGKAKAFHEQLEQLRVRGLDPVQLELVRNRFAHLQPQVGDDAGHTEEPVLPRAYEAEPPAQPSLDEFSLEADWALTNPFDAEPARRHKQRADEFDASFDSDLFSLPEVTEVVEWFADERLLDDEFTAAFADSETVRKASREQLAKLNMALAYIEQGAIDSACAVLNEVISVGDAAERDRAREILAKIA